MRNSTREYNNCCKLNFDERALETELRWEAHIDDPESLAYYAALHKAAGNRDEAAKRLRRARKLED